MASGSLIPIHQVEGLLLGSRQDLAWKRVKDSVVLLLKSKAIRWATARRVLRRANASIFKGASPRKFWRMVRR